MPVYKVTLDPVVIDGTPVKKMIKGSQVYPFGINNRGHLRISANDRDHALAIAHSNYDIQRKYLVASEMPKGDPERKPASRSYKKRYIKPDLWIRTKPSKESPLN